jgi:hypothetical protein
MGDSSALGSREFLCAERSKTLLRQWFRSEFASIEGALKAIQFLDKAVLLSTPYPSTWNRRGNFGVAQRCHYLWYRQGARIFGWCEQRQYPAWVREVVKRDFYPNPPSD